MIFSKIEKFAIYSYLHHLIYLIMNLSPWFLRRIVYRKRLGSLGKGSYIDYECDMRNHKQVFIGRRTIINRGCKFFGSFHSKDVKIVIGDNCAIAPYVTFFSAGHDYRYLDLPDTAKSIIVGSDVWIGGSALILPGVEIGEGAVVAAGSVVTKNVTPYTIVGGQPAVYIKDRILDKI